VAQQTSRIEDLHANQPLGDLMADLLPAREGDLTDEVVEGIMDRAGLQLGLRQAIEIGQQVGSIAAEFIIELAAGP